MGHFSESSQIFWTPATSIELDSLEACAVLLAVFGQCIGVSLDWAALLGALFLAHPVHTESAARKAGPQQWMS